MSAWLRWILITLALAAGSTHAQESGQWMRSGLEIIRAPAPAVDAARVAAQVAAGCADFGEIRFGDTASMRGTAPSAPWPNGVREQIALATLTDDPKQAFSLIDGARSWPDLSPQQRAILDNQRVMTALQFGDHTTARRLLNATVSPDAPGLAPALASDRRFWSVLVDAQIAGPDQWQRRLLPTLDRALAEDPTNFGVRVWRAIGWFNAGAWNRGQSCATRITELSDRVLDVSAAGACPLMLGHLSHVLDRTLARSQPLDAPAPRSDWRRFAHALLAILASDDTMVDATLDALSEEARSPCAPLMQRELRRIRRQL
jgi:hypothetical protein